MAKRVEKQEKKPRLTLAHNLHNRLTVQIDDLKVINPLTHNQIKFFTYYKQQEKAMMLHGVAGTGKTYIALYKALEEVLDRGTTFKKVVIVRSAVQAREIGHLPGDEMEKVYIAPRSWIRRPDPNVSFQFLMSWTLDDLMMFGRAFWYITSRTADGYPATFTRLPAGSITTTDMAGPVWFAPSSQVYFQGGEIDPTNLVQFLSPAQGLIYSAPGAIETALKLEAARNRNASSSIPAGVLKQTGGEPLSAQELADLASAFNAARATNQTAALNEYLTYTETNSTPDKMLLIEASQYQALEM